MLRAEVRATFTVVYRGYDIEVSRGPTSWRAGVYRRSADLPILYRSEVQTSGQDRRSSRRWIASMGCSGTRR